MAGCKRFFAALLLVICMVVSAQAEIATANGALTIDIPYLQYQGTYYHLILDYCQNSPNPADPQGLYWKYNTIYGAAEQPLAPETCATLDDAQWTIRIPYLYYMGYELSMTLTFYQNPTAPQGIYWKMTGAQLFPAFISAVKGPGEECIPAFTATDMQAFYAFQACIAGCGGNLQCISACGQNLPESLQNLGGFQLSCQFTSSSSGNVLFIIPAGAYFCPPSAAVQPMLVSQDIKITVAPGITKYCISTYCTNLDAEAPHEDALYSICGMVSNPCMLQLINSVRSKTLSGQDKGTLQDNIWDCTP